MAKVWKKIALVEDNISDAAYGAGWNGVTDVAPSKNAVYDEMELRAPKASPVFTGTATADNFAGIHEDTLLKSLSAETIAYLAGGGPQFYGVGGGAAMCTFHRPDSHAVNFGLDTDNVLKVGGYSMGAVARRIIYDELGQIKFPATQNASSDVNTLDDYKEGTTTGTPTAEVGSFTTATYTLNYIKVGRVVAVQVYVGITNKGTASGQLYVPLPVARNGYGCLSGMDVGVTGYMCMGFVSDTIVLVKYDGTGIINNGLGLYMTGVYFAGA